MKSNHEITYGQHKIAFTLHRKNVKNINLNLKPTLVVEVSASHEVPIEKIHSFVRKKASWIIKNKAYFIKSFPGIKNEKEYVSGESFKYLGKQFRLKVIKSEKEKVKFYRGYLYLHINNKDDYKTKRKLLDEWYKERTNYIFNESLQKMYKLVKKYDISFPKMNIRKLKARWGSCIENKNSILVNKDLIEAPKFCIDYVMLHELIHFKYRNHDNKFYDLISSLMPDWEKRKEILDVEIIKDI